MVALTQYVRGQPLLARQLNETVDAVNRLTDAQPTPKQTNRPVGDPELTPDENEEVQGGTDETFDIYYEETSRITSQIDVDGVLIDRIDSVTFVNLVDGKFLHLMFNNP